MKRKLIIAALIVASLCAATGAYLGWVLYGKAFGNQSSVSLRIRRGWDLGRLASELEKRAQLKNRDAFVSWAQRLGYRNVRPCTISIAPGAGLKKVIDQLKASRYQTVNVVVRGSMDAKALAEVLSQKIEVEDDSFILALSGGGYLDSLGFNDTTWQALFIPNTYNLYVSTELKPFLKRMKKEYDAFWNEGRRAQAAKQGLTPLQVAIIASIVTKESNQTGEYTNIAGVYINRFRKGMLLQADPTVVFARGKAGRLYLPDTRINSPYNTYVNKGLPPGPICIPNIPALEAVLNYSGHNFLYFCAKPDFSGFHNFAETLEEHNRNAAAFHRWLDSRGIK